MRARSVLVAVAAVGALALATTFAKSQEGVVEVVPNKEYDPSWMNIPKMLSKVPAVSDSSLQIVPLGNGKNMSVGLAQLGAHTRILGHIHKTHDEVAHVIEGSCKFKLGDDLIDFEPGMIVLIPARRPARRAGRQGRRRRRVLLLASVQAGRPLPRSPRRSLISAVSMTCIAPGCLPGRFSFARFGCRARYWRW